jgi:predicted small metal-binding protein
MLAVRCPICGDEVTSTNANDLTMSLRGHLAQKHEMTQLRGSGAGPVGGAIATEPRPRGMKESAGEKEFIGPRQEDLNKNRLRGQYVGPEQKDLKGCALEEQFVGPGECTEESTMMSLQCPMCDIQIQGENEDILSDRLKDHMVEVHDIKSKVTAPLSR